ncbi:MAG: hypothetical protein IPN90_13855 [Elusimicrobia bacterium]|nr:hypothetical protein [Elusimicrobiota bacterium]
MKGYDDPYSIAVDTTAHRLFVTDYGANRILVYNLDSNNILIERSADNVLGQTSFYGNGTGTTQSRLYNPNGLTFDSVGNRLFVSDGSNDRVLVFDVASITDGENAVNVLGQSDFKIIKCHSAKPDVSCLSAALDFTGNRLFVSDLGE